MGHIRGEDRRAMTVHPITRLIHIDRFAKAHIPCDCQKREREGAAEYVF